MIHLRTRRTNARPRRGIPFAIPVCVNFNLVRIRRTERNCRARRTYRVSQLLTARFDVRLAQYGTGGDQSHLTQRLRHQADSEHGFSRLVQQFHMPFGILLQAARNAADKAGADLGHFGPGGLAALE